MTSRSLTSKSLDPDLDAEAIKTVRQWLCAPGLRDGRPSGVAVSVEMAFTLGKSRADAPHGAVLAPPHPGVGMAGATARVCRRPHPTGKSFNSKRDPESPRGPAEEF